MLILAIMCLGILVGARFFPERFQKANSYLQMAATFVLIFCMGVKLGSRPDFLSEIQSLGWLSLISFLLPTAAATALVYLLSRWFAAKKMKRKEG
jgi:predicted permease